MVHRIQVASGRVSPRYPRWPLVILVLSIIASFFPPLIHAQDSKVISYEDHIAPILKRHCLQCHGDTKQESGLSLANYSALMKGSSGGALVVSGRSVSSRLLSVLIAEDPAERMPPENDPLSESEIGLVKSWIEGGLKQDAGSAAVVARTMNFTPSVVVPSVGDGVLPGELPHVSEQVLNRPFARVALGTSPNANLVAVAGYERVDFINTKLINTKTRESLGALSFPEGIPMVIRFSRSGATLMVAGGSPVRSGRGVLFDVATGRRLAEIGDESDAVLAADLSSDETKMAIGGSGRVVKVYSTVTGELKHTLVKHTDWITAMAYSPDGKFLASGDRVGNIHLWDAETGGVVLPLAEHKGLVRSLSWRSDGQMLASCGEDGLIVWWDVVKGWPAMSKPNAHPPARPEGVYGKIPNGVLDLAFGPKGELVSCGRDQQVRFWSSDGNLQKTFALDMETGSGSPSDPNAPPRSKTHARLQPKVLPLRVGFVFDGSRVIAGDTSGMVWSWSVDPSIEK